MALPAEDAHHLLHVLRLGPGAELSIFDGQGREWAARVVSASKRGPVTVELRHEIAPVAEPPVRVILGIGVLKGDQMDAVVRDATMLGVAEIAPFISTHVAVAARAWRGGAALGRWQRIAVASAKQCARATVPAITPAEALDSLLARVTVDLRVICVEPAQAGAGVEPIAIGALVRPRSALVLIGPEGGWSTEDLASAERHGARRVSLGPRTLRAETAPTVLLSALWTIWGW